MGVKINKFENFQEGIDYTIKKDEKAVNYEIYNKELRQILVDRWQKEGFFQDFSKSTPALLSTSENNKKDNSQTFCKEEIFCGLREEVPKGETNGEIKQVFYHWKIEEKENSQTKNTSTSNKKDQWIEREVNQENLPQELEKKDSNNNIYYGVGVILLVLLATGLVVVKIKKKK